MKSLRQSIERVRAFPERPWALATLVETEGSTYRKPGARLLADAAGETCIGVLSGGCLEEEIARQSGEIIAGAPPRLLTFDTRRLYGCDGLVRIYLERLPAIVEGGNVLAAAGDLLEARERCRIATDFTRRTASRILGPAELLVAGEGTFVHEVPLPIRLLLFGAGPEIAPLREIAQPLGWVIEVYPHPDELPADFRADSQTAALVMTHHFGRDLLALDRLAPLPLRYLGLLGPRRRSRQLVAELADCGRTLEALHAPAGLDIGSEAPEEIALALVSEITAVLAGRHGGHLRDRVAAIHPPAASERRVA